MVKRNPVSTKNPFKEMYKGTTHNLKRDGMHRPEGAGNFDNMDDYILSDLGKDLWKRSGTSLQPVNLGDSISTTGNYFTNAAYFFGFSTTGTKLEGSGNDAKITSFGDRGRRLRLSGIDLKGEQDEFQLYLKGNSTQTTDLVHIIKEDLTSLLTLDNSGNLTTAGTGHDQFTDFVSDEHFLVGDIDHTLILNIGSNTHDQIDTHLALTNEHIDWTSTASTLSTSAGVFAEEIGISGLTEGSVLFMNSSQVIEEDNGKFFWDNTAKALVLTQVSSGYKDTLILKAVANGADSAVIMWQNTGTPLCRMGADSTAEPLFQINSLAGIGMRTGSAAMSSTDSTLDFEIDSSGNVIIKGALRLIAKAGSTVDGDTWNDSTQKSLQTFVAGIEQTLSGVIFTQTADQTIANTVTETSMFGTGVGTLTLPANFWTVGKMIKIEIHGDFADTGNPTAEIQVYQGATSLIDSGAITLSGLSSTEEWECEILMVCRSVGETGTIETVIDWEYETTTGSSAVERLDVAGTLTTIDTTASQVLDATFQWGTAAEANTLTSEVSFVEIKN